MQHCLIIDSSMIILKVAGTILRDVGFRVEEAQSDTAGISHCRIEMPDVVYVDWRLPGGGGLNFLEQLKGLARVRRPRVIVWTTVDDPVEFKLAREAGADARVLKPFDRRALLEAAGRIAAST